MEPLSQQTVLKQKRYDLGIEQHDQEALSRLGTAAWDVSCTRLAWLDGHDKDGKAETSPLGNMTIDLTL